MTPDTLVTLNTLERFIWNIQQQAYQQGLAEGRATADSLQYLLTQAQGMPAAFILLPAAFLLGVGVATAINYYWGKE